MDWSNRSGYDRDRYQQVKGLLIARLGGECVSCAATELLEFDHIDPEGKKFSILSRWTRLDAAMDEELEKCQLLCMNCHRSKTYAAITLDHGEGKSGKRNCKCEPCRARKREYMRIWRMRRKAEVA